MQRVTHHGRATAYRVADRGGEGSPLLAVHGSGGTHEVWKGQLGRLAGRRPVVALDLSGHGESEDFEADHGWETLSAYADDVLAVAEETDAGVLVGNSLGGAVALQLVIERDHDFDGLVLAGTGAKLPVLDDLLRWLDSDFDRAVEFLHGEDRLFHDADSRYIQLSTEAMKEVGRRVTRRDFESCHAFDVRDRLGDVDVPALAVVGEHDHLTPPAYHEELADGIPDCEYAEVRGAAHLAMLEEPEGFNAAIMDFLDAADV
ncbi:alpha/beta fold hydrolase [Halorussus sp. MSC15.2]|uniref:alpha/beta fold hydrolase n=1 Tax=Halorussus sp. MSC15.2 TaxID=2283638 RepID=UPI0013D13E92|nr:alpha/beta hydrolase [Halorussus sp. MSC15.2]NEU56168.1 alpha/beta fold hydrolase [Halorussus sp. MSC15.2]